MLGIGLILLAMGMLLTFAEQSAGQIFSPLYSFGLAFLFGGLASVVGFVTDSKVVTAHNQIVCQMDRLEATISSISNKLDAFEKKIDKLNES
jgi:hypothetical protein